MVSIIRQFSRYSNHNECSQIIDHQILLIQQSLEINVLVQLFLWWIQDVSYLSVWQLGWNCQYNQLNCVDFFTLLQFPQHILMCEDTVSSVKSCCSYQNRYILLFQLAYSFNIGEFEYVKACSCIILENEDLFSTRCYEGNSIHRLYSTPGCHEIQIWSLDWHWYILPCNQVPNS